MSGGHVMESELQPAAAEWRGWTSVGVIEADRFCEVCGYNLRTQPVRREPTTQILLCRCPECGRFEAAGVASSAGRALLRRTSVLMLATWIALILGVFITAGIFDGVMSAFHFDITTQYVHRSAGINTRLAAQLPQGLQSGYVIRALPPQAELTMWTVLFGCSLGIGLVTGFLAVVALHYWRRWQRLLLVILMPCIAGLVLVAVIASDVPHLVGYMGRIVTTHALLQIAGGMVGLIGGRSFARLLVRMFVPPSWRGPLSHLWQMDGLPPAFGAARPSAAT